tara:strand:+ start:468 stop:668 length:201 start_codon:yes stop_codon:yes gene_type:complete
VLETIEQLRVDAGMELSNLTWHSGTQLCSGGDWEMKGSGMVWLVLAAIAVVVAVMVLPGMLEQLKQ